MVDVVEEALDVGLHDPADAAAVNVPAQGSQRVVAALAGAEAERERMELLLVDPLQHLHHSALHHLVFRRRDAQRPLLAIGLGNHPTARRARTVRTTMKPAFEILQVLLQDLGELFLRDAVHARRAVLFQL